jgi:3'-phosphoadenosine 5'-phosphosulfate sulfotransferase (PAPS reductase)/FAD synthetase
MSPPVIAVVEEALDGAAKRPGRVALLYSGGIESSLLLHLAEPWRDRITVYTVRTGSEFPHMVTFTDRALADWDHRIIKSDLLASFRVRGIPANVVPVEHTAAFEPAFGCRLTPAVVDWVTCCAENRNLPAYRAIKGDGITVAVHGQRARDFRGKRPPATIEGMNLLAPLWEVTRAEVREAVKSLRVKLPDHYRDFASSLDCSICPASLTPSRRAWMAKHYPRQLQTAEALHATVITTVVAALSGKDTHHDLPPK